MEAMIENNATKKPEIDVAEAREDLYAAVEAHAPLKKVCMLYARFVYAGMKCNKLHAAEQMGIDRRTLQRWSKVSFIFTPRQKQ